MMRRLLSLVQEPGSEPCPSRRTLCGRGIALVLGACGAGGAVRSWAQRDGEPSDQRRSRSLPPRLAREYAVKANYLANFARFVDWPGEAFPKSDTPIVIGVYGTSQFVNFLGDRVQRRMVNGRSILLRHIRKVDDTRDCHILFFNGRAWPHAQRVVHHLKETPVLTVGETPGFTQQGGIVNFITGDEKICLEVNQDAAKRAGLAISPKMLAYCTLIREDEK